MPDTNNPNSNNARSFARLAGNNWRTGRDNVRAAAHGYILAVVLEEFARKPLMEDMKKEMKYGRMDKADQRQVITLFSQANKVVDGWPTLPQEMKDRFITAGAKAYPYSTLAADIDKADKAAEKVAADEALAAELAELGVTVEEHEAAQERTADALANIAAMERVMALLNPERTFAMTDDEASAFARLAPIVTDYARSVGIDAPAQEQAAA